MSLRVKYEDSMSIYDITYTSKIKRTVVSNYTYFFEEQDGQVKVSGECTGGNGESCGFPPFTLVIDKLQREMFKKEITQGIFLIPYGQSPYTFICETAKKYAIRNRPVRRGCKRL